MREERLKKQLNDRYITYALLGVICLISGFDIIHDLYEKVPLDHIIHEAFIFAASIGVLLLQIKFTYNREESLSHMDAHLDQVSQERDEFRAKVKESSQAFAKAVEEEFTKWGLTDSEKDISILLIKGLTMKEIADIRKSVESTVRQQAMSIYKKSKLEGRQQLAAYFLEDLF